MITNLPGSKGSRLIPVHRAIRSLPFSLSALCLIVACRSGANRNDTETGKTNCPTSAAKVASPLVSSGENKKALGLLLPESAPVLTGDSAMATNSSITLDDATQATVGLQIKLVNIDNDTSRAICTGVLLGKNIVLTAAHCVAPPNSRPTAELSGYVIMAAGFDTARGAEIFDIDKVAVHPEWNGFYNDIAIVFAKKSFPDDRKAASVETKASEIAPSSPVVLVGYGVSGDGKNDGGVSRRGESLVHSIINRINYPESILVNQIRIKGTPDTSAGACTGDSGGPSFLKSSLRLVGIVSGMNAQIQSSMDCKNRDANYTIVELYLPWIESVTGQKPSTGNALALMKELLPGTMSSDATSAVGFVVKPPSKDSFQKSDNSGLNKSEDASASKSGGC
ncbi:hypothetical protein EBR21_03610 [bacterium]|nr:hypothetical protein [bacterium]